MSLAIQLILAVIVAFLPSHIGLPIAIAWIVWALFNAIDSPPPKALRPTKLLSPHKPPINLTTPYFITAVLVVFGWPILVLAYFLFLRPSA